MHWIPILLALAGALAFLPHLRRSTELVRVRNAFLFGAGGPESFDWIPGHEPEGYKLERRPPSPPFVAACEALGLAHIEDDWQRALAIGRHLLSAVRPNVGGPIQAGLEETYRRIVADGHGYCADFVDVFTALALTAGLQVRVWAFSFDGFGGHGHTFNEVWDRAAGQWRAIDVYNNYFFADADGRPMSAAAFRRELLAEAPCYRLVPVAAEVRPGFVHEAVGRGYYARGAAQWYLWWGVNVFSLAADPVVAWLGRRSTMMAQACAMLRGLHPQIRALRSVENEATCRRMLCLRRRLTLGIIALLAGVAGTGLTLPAGADGAEEHDAAARIR